VAARVEVKTLIRKLRHALPMALRASPKAGVKAEDFHAGEKLGRSTPKLVAYLTRLRPAVVALDGALAKYFKGQSAVTLLDQGQAALAGADTVQEIAVKDLPVGTLTVYEGKGRVLRGIEDLNRVGKIAFDGEAEMIAKFNKDILLRARKKREKKGPTGG